MTLVEFLHARIEDEGRRREAEDLADFPLRDVPESRRAEAEQMHTRLIQTQGIRLQTAMSKLGVAMFAGFRMGELRLQALKYADHPDYRDEWRP